MLPAIPKSWQRYYAIKERRDRSWLISLYNVVMRLKSATNMWTRRLWPPSRCRRRLYRTAAAGQRALAHEPHLAGLRPLGQDGGARYGLGMEVQLFGEPFFNASLIYIELCLHRRCRTASGQVIFHGIPPSSAWDRASLAIRLAARTRGYRSHRPGGLARPGQVAPGRSDRAGLTSEGSTSPASSTADSNTGSSPTAKFLEFYGDMLPQMANYGSESRVPERWELDGSL